MTQSKSDRIVSARTWITIQDTLVTGAVVVGLIGLVSVIATHLLAPDEVATSVTAIVVVLPLSMILLSYGLEEFRMNGMPYEEKIVEWCDGTK